MFVASYGAGGAYRRARQHGAAGIDKGLALAVDGSGNVTATGSFIGPAAAR